VIKGKVYKEHRLAFLYTFGRWPAQEIDHRNRIRDQNNFANLREATPAQNAANANAHKGTQSGVRGVYRHRSKWRAKIRANNLIYRLGTFATIEEAKAARDEGRSQTVRGLRPLRRSQHLPRALTSLLRHRRDRLTRLGAPLCFLINARRHCLPLLRCGLWRLLRLLTSTRLPLLLLITPPHFFDPQVLLRPEAGERLRQRIWHLDVLITHRNYRHTSLLLLYLLHGIRT
jgi:hypothetical protein